MHEHAEGATEPATAGAAEVHRRLVEAYDEVLAGRLDDALALIDPAVIDHRGGLEGDHHGRDAWRRKWERVGNKSDFHDVSATIEHNVASDNASTDHFVMA